MEGFGEGEAFPALRMDPNQSERHTWPSGIEDIDGDPRIGGFFGLWPMIDLILILVGAFTDAEGRLVRTWEHVPAVAEPSARAGQVRQRVEEIESRLTELQSVMLDLNDKQDRRQYGQLL